MGIKYKLIFTLFSILAVVFLVSCSINEPTAPRWDVSLNVPIVKKNYTMYDIVEKKSKEIKHYTDGANFNILYYSDVKELDRIEVKDELKIDPFSDNTAKSIGVVSIAADSVTTEVDYSWFGISIIPNTFAVLPPVSNHSVTSDFTAADQFEYAKIESGQLDLTFTNNLPSPVGVTISNLEIRNSLTGELIVKYLPEINLGPIQVVSLPSLPIEQGVTIKKELTMNCRLSTTGSSLLAVLLPQNSLSVKAKTRDVEVKEVLGKIPDQEPEVVEGNISIDEGLSNPTMYQNVKFESGLLNFTLTNNLNVDASIVVTVPNLKNPQGAEFTETRTIPRKQTVNIFNNFSLQNYSLVSSNTPTNQVTYTITYKPLASTDFRIVQSTDDVSGNIRFSSLQVKEFSGILKPTELEQTRSAVSMDVKDMKDKLQFEEINFKNPIIELILNPTSQMEFEINGHVEARNSAGQKVEMPIATTLINENNKTIKFNSDEVNNFFKKFTKFPDSLIVYTGGVVNPNHKQVNIKNTDYIEGSSRIEIPLHLGISGAEITDSVEIDLSSDDRDKINDVNSFAASLKISNGIAADVVFTGKLYDESNNFLMYFPPKHSDQDTVITVQGAAVDNNGDVVSVSEKTITVKTVSGEPEKLTRAKYMRVRLKFNTSGQGNTPVKFRTDDNINITASGAVNYIVNNEGK